MLFCCQPATDYGGVNGLTDLFVEGIMWHFMSVWFCEQTRYSCNWPSTGLWLVEDLKEGAGWMSTHLPLPDFVILRTVVTWPWRQGKLNNFLYLRGSLHQNFYFTVTMDLFIEGLLSLLNAGIACLKLYRAKNWTESYSLKRACRVLWPGCEILFSHHLWSYWGGTTLALCNCTVHRSIFKTLTSNDAPLCCKVQGSAF